MNRGAQKMERRDRVIAGLLLYGTWLASAIIAVGLVLEGLGRLAGVVRPGVSGYGLMTAGIAILVLLPVARVFVLLVIFLHERDYVYVAISALVLAIIGAGVLAGLVFP